MKKDFWSSSTVAVVGGGSWGTVLAHLVAKNCAEVRVWVRGEEQARVMNSTRTNPNYVQGLDLSPKIKTFYDYRRAFEIPVHAVIWALPSAASRSMGREIGPLLRGDEILLHATKGIEENTLKRISVVLREELPIARIGVISGPNLALEIARGEPAATVVASPFLEVIQAGKSLLTGSSMKVYGETDLIGVEWGGTLKNIFAIASGILESLGLGWNTRSFLVTRGLAEMVRFGVAMGGRAETFLGLSGIGDLLATCSSAQSRNYRVGYALAQGESLDTILSSLGRVAEGVRTTQIVWNYARSRGVQMPITETVYKILNGECSVRTGIEHLMARPIIEDHY